MMHAPSTHSPYRTAPPVSGGRMISTSGRALPLVGAALTADAAGGVARVTVEQRFHNPHAEPLAVTYSLPLPADGAVSGFSFRVGGRRVVGEIDRKRAARERYEEALAEGRSAALLEQDRSSLFTQEIGNIPPGEEVTVEVCIDQRLRWLDEGAWEWRFPTVVAARYLGAAGAVPDADRVAQHVADGPLPARFSLSCTLRDAAPYGLRPESPSHAPGGERVRQRGPRGAARSGGRAARPRRGRPLEGGDPARRAHARHRPRLPGSRRRAARPRAPHGGAALDRRRDGRPPARPHRAPRHQRIHVRPAPRPGRARHLGPGGHAARRAIGWSSSSSPARPAAGSPARSPPPRRARRDAAAWLRSLRASGSTEMRTGILEALAGVRAGAQRQVVLITDGQIGFESQVVAAICDRLPSSSRLHTVGVGSAVNRSLTGPAARAGHGVEIVLGLGEDPERAAARLVARTDRPLLVDLTLGGSALIEHAPERLPDLFAGAPALIGVALRPEGGELVVRGRTLEGTWEQRLHVAPVDPGQGNLAAVTLFGREAVEDRETRLAAGDYARDVDAAIEQLGIDFQISTRLTSWIAVSNEETVDPGDPLRRRRMPHELPYGMSAEGLGLRAAMPAVYGAAPMPMAAMPAGGMGVMPRPEAMPSFAQGRVRDPEAMERSLGGAAQSKLQAPPPSLAVPGAPPPPAATGSAAPRRGVLGAIKDFFGIDTPPAKEESITFGEISDEDPWLDELAAPAPAPARWLRGRIAVHSADLLVIEVFPDGAPLAWAAAGEARITLASGQVLIARIDARRTTRKGTVAVGAAARLALVLPPGASLDVVQSIQIELDGASVSIAV